MMKKFIAILLAMVLMATVLSGCVKFHANITLPGEENNEPAATAVPDGGEKEVPDGKEDKNTSPDGGIEINCLKYELFGGYEAFVIVKNNTNDVIQAKGTVYARNANGDKIDEKEVFISPIGPAEYSIQAAFFEDGSEIDSIACDVGYSEEPALLPVVSGIKVNYELNPTNVSMIVTNNNDYDIYYLDVYALFFDGNGDLIDYSSDFICDIDGTLKAGRAMPVQLDCNVGEYDSVQVYFNGRGDGTASKLYEGVTEKDLEIEKFLLDEDDGTHCFLGVTNNSEEDISLYFCAAADNDEGHMVGAAESSVSVLGAGQTTIVDLWFNVPDVDNAEYNVYIRPADGYQDVIKELAYDYEMEEDHLDFSITNNGDVPAEFVVACVLYFDLDGEICSYDYSYFMDDDCEIKPGETISKEINLDNDAAAMAVYLSGYHFSLD